MNYAGSSGTIRVQGIAFCRTEKQGDAHTVAAWLVHACLSSAALRIALSKTVDGFCTAKKLSPQLAGAAKKILAAPTRYDGRVMTSEEFIRGMRMEGRTPSAVELKTIKEMPADRYETAGTSEDFAQERKIQGAKSRTEYRLTRAKGSHNVVSKTEYEFFNYLKGNEK
jgi:hypothetical protein